MLILWIWEKRPGGVGVGASKKNHPIMGILRNAGEEGGSLLKKVRKGKTAGEGKRGETSCVNYSKKVLVRRQGAQSKESLKEK